MPEKGTAVDSPIYEREGGYYQAEIIISSETTHQDIFAILQTALDEGKLQISTNKPNVDSVTFHITTKGVVTVATTGLSAHSGELGKFIPDGDKELTDISSISNSDNVVLWFDGHEYNIGVGY